MRHPMYDWPNLAEVVNSNNTFMLGPALRVTVSNNEVGSTADFDSYFPRGNWLEYYTYKLFNIGSDVGKTTVYGGFNRTNVHIKGGSIVPIQDVSEASCVKNTVGLLSEPMKLLIVPSESGFAEGNLFIARGR